MGTALASGLATAASVTLSGMLLLKWKLKPRLLEAAPRTMRRLVLVEAHQDLKDSRLEVQEVSTPQPRWGQVLVKVAAAPVYPSDDGIWRVPPKQGYPLPIGNEGSGRVIASGGGLFASRLLGKNVAIMGNTYAEYAVVDAMQRAFTLPSDILVEDGCAFFVNPFTVVGIVETAKESGRRAFIHTAAASQLGQMMVKYCKKERVDVVNVVRRQDQVNLLRELGATYVVNTGEEGWQEKLATLIKDLGIKCAFDAIAGDMAGTLLTMLPPGGTVWVYGRLAPEPVGNIQPLDLIYRGKQLKGFMLTNWLMKGGMLKALLRTMRTAKIVRSHLSSTFASNFKDTSLLETHRDYIALLASGVTGQKMRVRPHGHV